MGLDTVQSPLIESIEKAEQPQGNFVSETGFNIIGGNEAVAHLLDLVIRFGFAAHFKGISRFYNKVAPFGKLNRLYFALISADLVSLAFPASLVHHPSRKNVLSPAAHRE